MNDMPDKEKEIYQRGRKDGLFFGFILTVLFLIILLPSLLVGYFFAGGTLEIFVNLFTLGLSLIFGLLVYFWLLKK